MPIKIFACIALLFAATRSAHADDVAAAAQAFSQAQAAMMASDASGAADLYELADSLAPSAPALRNAARARLAAGHVAAAATWAVEILRRYPNDKESRDIADAILAKLTPQLTAVEVRCSEPCKLVVDGKAFFPARRDSFAFYTLPGARTVAGLFAGDRKAEKQITAKLGTNVVVSLTAPALAVAATDAHGARAHRAHHGISKWWALAGGVATVGLAGTSTWSGLQTLHTRDQIKSAVAAGNTVSANTLYDRGSSEQTRTNILFAATGVAGIATIVALVFTDWSGEHLDVAPAGRGAAGATLGYRGRF